MSSANRPARTERIRRVLGKAEERYRRRYTRTTHIRTLITAYYGKQPVVGNRMVIYEDWDGKLRRWVYDYSLGLEWEAEILVNRLQRMLH